MKYECFGKLYRDALDYLPDDFESYVAERGWEEWMDEYCKEDNDTTRVVEIMKEIFKMAHTDLKDIRKECFGIALQDMAQKFYISERTLRSWFNGEREMSDYLLLLMLYVHLIDFINGYDKEDEE